METKASGKDIIVAVLDNMRQSGEPLLYRTLVPSYFDVYLHRSDYERLSGIFSMIRDECVKALDQELAALNRKGLTVLSGLASKPPYVNAEKNWSVKFHIDEDNELAPGEILIDSRLVLPAAIEYGVGTRTQRSETLRSDGETGKFSKSQELKEEKQAVLARLSYKDSEGNVCGYEMTAPEISVGRGGRNEFCDLELDGPADISRRHFYLRQDPQTGEFFIQDVSRFGTSVGGTKLPPKEWVRLPSKTTLVLADAVTMEFEQL
ncbi:MAG: FHA domain-containing protein [Acidobacteria bacterium]|nr:FHA domain-containing protein [Acidobacteriota bacterium]